MLCSSINAIINGYQGRIQDLSEGGQDFLGTKKFLNRNKKARLDLKDSKRVKINDLGTIKRLFRNKEQK